jgi:molybdopterin converting factor small subunit
MPGKKKLSPVGRRLNLELPSVLYEKLETFARELDLSSKSEVLRTLIALYEDQREYVLRGYEIGVMKSGSYTPIIGGPFATLARKARDNQYLNPEQILTADQPPERTTPQKEARSTDAGTQSTVESAEAELSGILSLCDQLSAMPNELRDLPISVVTALRRLAQKQEGSMESGIDRLKIIIEDLLKLISQRGVEFFEHIGMYNSNKVRIHYTIGDAYWKVIRELNGEDLGDLLKFFMVRYIGRPLTSIEDDRSYKMILSFFQDKKTHDWGIQWDSDAVNLVITHKSPLT